MPCARKCTFSPRYLSIRVRRYTGNSTEMEFAISSMRVASGARSAIQPRKANAGILQIDVVHQVMQRDVRVVSAEPRDCRLRQAQESRHRLVAEGRKQQVEPHHIRLDVVDGLQSAALGWTASRSASSG